MPLNAGRSARQPAAVKGGHNTTAPQRRQRPDCGGQSTTPCPRPQRGREFKMSPDQQREREEYEAEQYPLTDQETREAFEFKYG